MMNKKIWGQNVNSRRVRESVTSERPHGAEPDRASRNYHRLPYLLFTVYFWFLKTNLLKTGRKKVLKASEMCSAQILYENMKYVCSKTFVTIKTIYKPFQNSLFDYFNV